MLRSALLPLLLFCFVSGDRSVAQEKRSFEPEDWAALRVAHSIAVSPDGKTILYEVNHGAEQGHTQSEWWLLQRDGGNRRKLDIPKKFSPMGFTPTGDSLYGTWEVGVSSQFAIFRLQETTSLSVPHTTVLLPRGLKSATPSPDGAQFALTYDPRPRDPLAKIRTIIEPDKTGIYVVRSDGTGGTPWCENLHQVSDLAWSPNSQLLAVVSNTPKIGFHTVTSFLDVCSQADSRRIAVRSTVMSSIAWEDAGKSLAFLSTSTHVLTPDHVWTVPVHGGNAVDQTPSLPGSAMQLAADAQGRVWVTVQRGVQQEVDRLRDGVLKPEYKWPEGNVGLPVFSPYANGSTTLAFTVDDSKDPANVALLESGVLRRVTKESQHELDAVGLADVRSVHWTSKEGVALEGIATFPVHYQHGNSYPFLVFPHGGPEANDTLAFNPLAQIFAAQGYFVLQPEYRGSTGYGSAFLEDIYQHRGDRAYQDVDSATDFAIAQGWADPKRLAIFGWSAGGFITAWTVTQTNRYKAAVDGAGVTDWESFVWASDIVQTDYDERWPGETPDAFRKFSPVLFADKVKTPLLILHGAADRRIPTYQGLEFFQALAAHGATVKMVTYPDSPHFPVLWQQRLDLVAEVCAWLAEHNP
jgi:dipeptidyl aminopeptidase/acylaminoacyl peptidase